MAHKFNSYTRLCHSCEKLYKTKSQWSNKCPDCYTYKRNCVVCGKKIITQSSMQIYCSRECNKIDYKRNKKK